MAVMKLTKSKNALQFIDDDGNVFQTSLGLMRVLLQGKATGDFVLLSRLPLKASADRFQKSPLYDPHGMAQTVYEPKAVSQDVFSKAGKAEQSDVKKYNEDVVIL